MNLLLTDSVLVDPLIGNNDGNCPSIGTLKLPMNEWPRSRRLRIFQEPQNDVWQTSNFFFRAGARDTELMLKAYSSVLGFFLPTSFFGSSRPKHKLNFKLKASKNFLSSTKKGRPTLN